MSKSRREAQRHEPLGSSTSRERASSVALRTLTHASTPERFKRCTDLLPALRGLPEYGRASAALDCAQLFIRQKRWTEADSSLNEFASYYERGLHRTTTNNQRENRAKGGKATADKKKDDLAQRNREICDEWIALGERGIPECNRASILGIKFDLTPTQIRNIVGKAGLRKPIKKAKPR